MTSTVNIGLAKSGGGFLNAAQAVAALSVIGGVAPSAYRVLQSDSEPTLVAELRRPLHASAAYEIARHLKQDAVAVWDGREGHLYGPNAASWGPFNPAFFLTLDGGRLAAPLAA